jgi:hypothetical protein
MASFGGLFLTFSRNLLPIIPLLLLLFITFFLSLYSPRSFNPLMVPCHLFLARMAACAAL